MAITQASLTGAANTVDASSFTTASITPTANRLVIAVIYNRSGITDPAETPTLSGNGLTWVQITTTTAGNTRDRVTMFRAMGASPSSGAVTIDFAGNTQNACHHSIFEFAGIDTSGTNGSGAVVQSATNSGTATSLTVTLAAFGSTDNGATSGFEHRANEATTPETNWTEIHDVTEINPNSNLETQWRADNDTTASASWTTLANCGGIAIEIKAAAAVAIAEDESYVMVM